MSEMEAAGRKERSAMDNINEHHHRKSESAKT